MTNITKKLEKQLATALSERDSNLAFTLLQSSELSFCDDLDEALRNIGECMICQAYLSLAESLLKFYELSFNPATGSWCFDDECKAILRDMPAAARYLYALHTQTVGNRFKWLKIFDNPALNHVAESLQDDWTATHYTTIENVLNVPLNSFVEYAAIDALESIESGLSWDYQTSAKENGLSAAAATQLIKRNLPVIGYVHEPQELALWRDGVITQTNAHYCVVQHDD